jgi:pyruvate/2-oxoglutarate dehydrogenase complex dihydrolipoamide acyltransferase (E2) component
VAFEFRLPDIGEGLTEAEVVRWLVPVGATVAVDQPVVEVETDKAVVEIPSPRAGVVLHHGAAAGETLAVGEILVVIGDDGEPWPSQDELDEEQATDEGMPEAPPPHELPGAATATPIVGSLSEEAEELVSKPGRTARALGRVQALPLVRKLAAELGVDLTVVSGSGPEGRITREDVMAAARTGGEAAEPVPPTLPPVPVSRDGEVRALSKLRRTIAANMARSWSEIPHVTTFDEVDAARLLHARRALEGRHQVKVPLEALVIKAVIPALATFPEFNATLHGDNLILHGQHDVGVAVDTPDGLLVAVVRGAGQRTLLETAAEILRLAEGAKARKLGAGELTGQTFTVSNIGALGGGFGTPLIPPGTTAILSLGMARERAVAVQGQVGTALLMPLSLSYDHRVIDGGLGRRFMALVLENLAEPALFLA